ncbi:immunoglobulin-like domain-containing protein [Peloplasma aerotolerans]|uniref:DUF5011 domain-containing protein n=1 Tax=Peloplasma aerotolerans TaxID=3044389 RepID=A0AAW6UB02_9MOLU|nr:immunoglobulin-like domain-containing protein [Mariniplasma sp. M4Ah]MDI6453597.1 DUF5011 domain-containing protein [Mariniplasma sp. M4Ah]
MKKVFYTIFILFMAITLVACKGGEPTDPVDPTPTEDPTPTPVDTLAPLLFGVSDVVVDVGGEFDPLAGITATDNVDGNLTSQINVSGEYDLDVAGVYTLTYTVSDAAGNVATATRQLIVRVAPASELFVTNGDFSEPLDGTWTHWAGEGGASTVQVVDGVLEYNITANGSNWWSSQFSQPNLVVPQGKAFKFQFDAKADEPRAIVTKLENAQYVGYFDEAHMLTTEWVTYEIEFFVTAETITNGKLIFGGGTTAAYLTGGNALTKVYLDNVKFIELEPSEDDVPPVISGALDKIIDQNEVFNPLQGITVSDNMDTTLTVDDIVIDGTVDSSTPGDYVLTYTLEDASGNETVVTRTITVADGLAPSTWLVVNGDFEEDQLTPLPQPAETGWGWHGAASFDARIQGGMAIIDVHTLGTTTFGVQFYQQNRVIEQGRIYKVTFDARADIARPIQVALEQGTTRRFDQIVDITTSWETYEIYIDHILPGYTNGKFAFFMGLVGSNSVPTTVYLDNVTVERVAEIVDEAAPELRGVEDYIIRKGISFDPLAGVTIFDAVDKDVTVEDIVVDSNLDTDLVGDYTITYTVEDASGNEAIYTRTIHVVEAEDMPQNSFLIINGDFEEDQTAPAAAGAGWGWHGGGTFTVEIADGMMTQVITNVGTVPHGTQFYQLNRVIDTRATYLLTFDAKVEDARSIRLSLEAGTSVNWFKVVDITTDWVTYEAYITVPGGGFTNGKFAFFAGLVEANSPATTFYLDNVSIELVGYLVDEDAPMIFGVDEVETIEGLEFDPLLGVTVFDVVDKSLTPQDIVITGEVDTDTPGDYELTYTLTDKSGNVTSIVRHVVVSASDGSIPTTFVLINGDFDEDQTAPAAAGAGWGWHGNGQFNVNIENGVAQIDVFETWTQFFGVQFYILNRTVTQGHTYRITFRAKADDARPIQLNLESSGARFSAFFDLDTEYAEYVYEYKHETASFTNGKFSFFVGNIHSFSTPTSVYFDYVKVERIMEKSPDTVAPQIWGALDTVWLQGEAFDPMLGLRVYDHVDKTLTVDDIEYTGTVNVDVPGDYDLVYTLEDASGNVLTHTRVITVVEAEDMVAQRINFIDGDFEDETPITTADNNMGWTLKTGPGTGTWNQAFVDGHFEIDILTVGTAPHGIQFFQRNGFYLEAHTTYSISFKAKADVVRDIRVIMENPSENFRNLSLHTVELGTDWTTYELVIHNGFTTTADAKIGFFLGLIDADAPERSAATKVYFDDVEVKLIGYAVDEVAPMIWVADAEVEQDAVFNPLTGVKYGDFAKAPQLVITSETAGLVTFNEGVYTIDTSTVGNFIFTYTVTDIYGNVTVFDRALNIVEPVIE